MGGTVWAGACLPGCSPSLVLAASEMMLGPLHTLLSTASVPQGREGQKVFKDATNSPAGQRASGAVRPALLSAGNEEPAWKCHPGWDHHLWSGSPEWTRYRGAKGEPAVSPEVSVLRTCIRQHPNILSLAQPGTPALC